nr:hypothetical protein [Tanacetum cinerariifolium]
MENEHLDTISETESDEFIKSSVENLVPIPSESEDFSNIESECDMSDCDDSQTIKFSTIFNPLFNDSNYSDDESSHEEVIHELSFKTYSNPLFDLDEEIISSEFNPIHNEDLDSTLKNDRFDTKSYLLESLLNRDTLMASSPKFDSFFEEFSGELAHTDLIPPGINEAFYDDHVKEISSGSTTTYSDSFLYDSFIFDLSINPFPPADRSDFYEFADELTHIISPPKYDCVCFKIEPNSGDFTMDVVEDTFPTRESRVHNALTTHSTFQLNLDFILSSETLFAYVVKDNKERDKIRAKSDKIKSKREARKSPDSRPTKSKPSQSQESIKEPPSSAPKAYSDLHRSKWLRAYLLLWNFRELDILNSEPNLQSDIETLAYALTSNKNILVPLMSREQMYIQTSTSSCPSIKYTRH